MDTPGPHLPLSLIMVDDNPIDIDLMRWVLEAPALSYALHVIAHGDDVLEVVAHLAA